MRLHEDTARTGFDAEGDGVRCDSRGQRARPGRVVIGTKAAQGVLRRFSAWVLRSTTTLMTEPLTPAQLDSIGWEGREGLTDAGNQFHYYRRTLDDRVLFGGLRRELPLPRPHRPSARAVGGVARPAGPPLLRDLPAARGLALHPPVGGVIDTTSRFTPVFGTALGGRLAYAIGYTGLGVGSTRFGARVALDLVDGRDTEATRLRMVRTSRSPSRQSRSAMPLCGHPGGPRSGGPHRASRPGLKVLDRLGVGFDSRLPRMPPERRHRSGIRRVPEEIPPWRRPDRAPCASQGPHHAAANRRFTAAPGGDA